MASPLLGLPDELLQHILLKLPKKDTKAARLTCTRLADNGAHHLFKRIYFAPRRKVMQDFERITNNPIFGKSVEELIYDSRLFIGYDFHEGDPSKCPSRCTRTTTPAEGCGWRAMYFARTGSEDVVTLARRHNGFYADQQAILENGHDFRLLCKGLKRMPKISTLSLRDDFRFGSRYSTGFFCADDWYVGRTLKEFGSSIRPSYWIFTDDASQTGDDEIIHSCDVRGVTSLYKALTLANVKLLNLNACLPVNAEFPPQIPTVPLFPGLSLSHRLTTVEIQIDWRPSWGHIVQSQQHSPDMVLSSLPDFLSSSKLLERLSVMGYGYKISELWITCFTGLHWPQLKSLGLSYVVINCNELESLISMHRESLRELTLDCVHLINGWSKVADWDSMTNELGACLALTVVSLVRLLEDPKGRGGWVWLEVEHQKVLAGNLMGRHSYTVTLEEAGRSRIAVARRT